MRWDYPNCTNLKLQQIHQHHGSVEHNSDTPSYTPQRFTDVILISATLFVEGSTRFARISRQSLGTNSVSSIPTIADLLICRFNQAGDAGDWWSSSSPRTRIAWFGSDKSHGVEQWIQTQKYIRCAYATWPRGAINETGVEYKNHKRERTPR